MATAASATSTSSGVQARIQPTIIDLVPFTSIRFLDDKPIGYGAFGAVYKALHSEWGCQVAYKKLAVVYIGERSKPEQQFVLNITIITSSCNYRVRSLPVQQNKSVTFRNFQ